MSKCYAGCMLIFLFCLWTAGPTVAEEVTVSGQVLGPDGQPATDSQVVALYGTPDAKTELVPLTVEANGTFTCTAETYAQTSIILVIALKEGLATDWAWLKDGERATLRLGAEAASCAGRVTDPDGQPIPGATVWVARIWRPDTSEARRRFLVLRNELVISDTTDENGRFRIAGLPTESEVQLAALADGKARLQIPERWSPDKPALPAGKKDVTLVLQPGASISGRAGYQGRALAGIYILSINRVSNAYCPDVITKEDGSYILDHLSPGIYDIMAERPPEGLTAPAAAGVTVKAGDHFTGADFEFTPGGVVTGKILEAGTGRPIAGAKLAAYGPARPLTGSVSQRAESDEAGNYEFRLPPGRSKINCWGTEGYPPMLIQPREQWVEVVEGETISGVDFVLHAAPKLRGQVLLPDGQSAAGVNVDVTNYGRLPDNFLEPQTDAEGKFELDTQSHARYYPPWIVMAQDLGRDLVGIAFVESADEPINIRLAQAAYVTVPVIDADEEPMADLAVSITITYGVGQSLFLDETRTDEGGLLRIGPLPPGRRLLLRVLGQQSWFIVRGGFTATQNITLTPGEVRELLPLQFDLAGRSVRGWVGDGQQRAVPGALIFAAGAHHRDPVSADEAGYFELTRLKLAGKVQVLAAHPTEPLFAAVEIDPDWGFRANLILKPLGSATGRVVDQQGSPVRNARVLVSTSGAREGQLLRRLKEEGFQWWIDTDEAGTWRIEGLIAGASYQVQSLVSGPSATSAHTLTFFTAESGTEIDLGETVLKE